MPQPAALWPSPRNVLRQRLAIFSNEYYQIQIATHLPTPKGWKAELASDMWSVPDLKTKDTIRTVTFHMIPRHSGETARLAISWNAGRTILVKLLTSVDGLRPDDVASFCISRMTQWHRLLLLLPCLPSDDDVVVGNSALAVVQARELHAIYSNHITPMLFTAMTSHAIYSNTRKADWVH